MIEYSEIFKSIQGEGIYTGVPTLWLRHWMCNLTCSGFGQEDPTNPDTYDLPYQQIDASQYDRLEDMPVIHKGCDSAYSWAKKFEHLAHSESTEDVCERILSLTDTHSFVSRNGTEYHMCFTGGEPLLKKSQRATIDILNRFHELGKAPRYITFETNGTQTLLPEFVEFLNWYTENVHAEILWSFSPKLFNTSGEPFKRAIKSDRMATYLDVEGSFATYKFVVNGTQDTWNELEEVIEKIEESLGHDIRESVWIMPEGGTYEMVKRHDSDIANQTIDRGYKVATRVQNYIFSNTMGT